MKAKGQINYSNVELKRMKMAIRYNKTLPKPLSIVKIARTIAKDLNRGFTGVYSKMLGMTKRTNKRVTVQGPKVSTQKQITFGKPTKIEISDNGMTFYF